MTLDLYLQCKQPGGEPGCLCARATGAKRPINLLALMEGSILSVIDQRRHLLGDTAVAGSVGFRPRLGDPKHALGHVGSNPLPVARLWTGQSVSQVTEVEQNCVSHFALLMARSKLAARRSNSAYLRRTA